MAGALLSLCCMCLSTHLRRHTTDSVLGNLDSNSVLEKGFSRYIFLGKRKKNIKKSSQNLQKKAQRVSILDWITQVLQSSVLVVRLG